MIVMNTDARVATIMSTDVIAVTPETSVTELARLMVEHDVSGIPVVDDGILVGLVTEVDVVSREIDVDPPAFGTFLDAIFRLPWDKSDEELRRVLASTAGELMTRDVKTISPDAPIRDAANMMFKQELNPLPVVDDHGRLLGIISRSDIVRLVAEASEIADRSV
ncbi:MAG TPA: IMP dehydrogenase [Chloroflexi bacterium]|jgi:CBS domain-containing protein|nr:IMP dehydrogenase [Chloroflexota bacterium]